MRAGQAEHDELARADGGGQVRAVEADAVGVAGEADVLDRAAVRWIMEKSVTRRQDAKKPRRTQVSRITRGSSCPLPIAFLSSS